ncbi:hypothetical protein HDV05_008656 [Chytridiales sp. JEL 0842]|nr:hypothetical protein HDV05_008656 [Chytridiales sp. JEL 0842]
MQTEKRIVEQLLSTIARRPIKHSWDYDPSPSASLPIPPPSRPFALKEGEPVAESQVEITVKQLKGTDAGWKVKVGRLATIEDVKEMVAVASGIPASQQRLVYKGKALIDNKTILDFDIKEGATINLLKKAGAATPETAPSPTPSPQTAKAAPKKQVDPFQTHAKTAALNPAFWASVKDVLSSHFTDPAEKQKVMDQWGQSFVAMLKELPVEERTKIVSLYSK